MFNMDSTDLSNWDLTEPPELPITGGDEHPLDDNTTEDAEMSNMLVQMIVADIPAGRPVTKGGDNGCLLREGINDEGNAQCVAKRYPGKFAHNEAMGWLGYDGKRFAQEGGEAILDRAVVETLKARIVASLKSGRTDKYKELISKSIPNAGKVAAAKSLLQSIVYTPADQFDCNHDLLNCNNGVVDLRTGELHPHSPDYRFTYRLPTDYNKNGNYTEWESFLLGAVGKRHIVDWLKMAVGYSLTGHTREEILFYIYGPTRSGKGTFTETLLELLGKPMAKEVDFSIFTTSRSGDSQNFDLATLRQCRLISASESNAYERFNEAKIKALTGGNEVFCAFKHREHFNYRPQYKIWLSSNQPVNADPDDEAVWGRMRVIEFPNSFLGKENKYLKHSMKTPEMLRGVLRWAIEGARAWYETGSKGLPEIEESKQLKTEQRSELDAVQQWIDECCQTGDGMSKTNAPLYLSYQGWCKDNGVEPKKHKSFSQALKRKGFEPDRTGTGRIFRGIDLR